jgi:hypothetical protein
VNAARRYPVTAATKTKSGFFIGVGCPGCGGRLQIERDFFVLSCEHCGSAIRLVMPDIPAAFMMRSRVTDIQLRPHVDRYLKKHGLPLTGSQLTTKKLYYPYWKIDATVLKLRNKTETRAIMSEYEGEVEHTVEMDKSSVSVSPYHLTVTAGAEMEGIPETIGIRSQTMQVIPFSRANVEDGFDTLPVFRRWESVRDTIRQSADTLSHISPADFGENLTRVFNPVFSLVYFPYFLAECYDDTYRRFVVDGLSGRVLTVIYPESEDASSESDGADHSAEDTLGQMVARDISVHTEHENSELAPRVEFGQLDVEFHRCHNCGTDLPPELSHVYICSNCHHLQLLNGAGGRLEDLQAVAAESERDSKLVPFWWLRVPEIMAGAFGNLLGGVDHSERMYVPAIRSANFEGIYKLARRMSAAHLRMSSSSIDRMDQRFLSVRVGLAEAIALAEMIVYRELVERGFRLPEEEIEIQPKEFGLVFVPFHLESYFYVDSALNAIGMERTLIE